MNQETQTNVKQVLDALPTYVETIENAGLVFKKSETATLAEIEKDLIRTIADLLDITPESSEAVEHYQRIHGLAALRSLRMGVEDDWLMRLIQVILRRS